MKLRITILIDLILLGMPIIVRSKLIRARGGANQAMRLGKGENNEDGPKVISRQLCRFVRENNVVAARETALGNLELPKISLHVHIVSL